MDALGGVFRGTVYAQNGSFEGIVKAKSVYSDINNIANVTSGVINPTIDGCYFIGEGYWGDTLPEVTLTLPDPSKWKGLRLNFRTARTARKGGPILLNIVNKGTFMINSIVRSPLYCTCHDGCYSSFISNGVKWIVETANTCSFSDDLSSWYDKENQPVTIEGDPTTPDPTIEGKTENVFLYSDSDGNLRTYAQFVKGLYIGTIQV